MWKRKLEAEAPEAAIFYGSGSGSESGKRKMNGSGSGSGSSKKNIGSGSGSDKNLPLPPLPLLRYLRQNFSFFHEYFEKLKPFWPSTKWKRKRKRLHWKRKWVNFKTVEAEAASFKKVEAETLHA